MNRSTALALALALVLASSVASADPDLPGPAANLESLPAGSLVIPMDNSKQSLVAPFNLRAYGLVNALLWDGVPVKWAIKAGKAKDGTDFSGEAQRILPTTLAAAVLDFRAGPFVIHKDWAEYRTQRILRPGFIKIGISNIQIRAQTKNLAIIDFQQSFDSLDFSDRVVKRLGLSRINSQWKITDERVLTVL